jgi:hypothetical protein
MDDDNADAAQSTTHGGAVDDLTGIFGPSNATSATQQASPFTAQQQKASTADILSMFSHSPAQGPALSQPQPRPMAPGYGSYPSATSGGALGGGIMGGQWQQASGQAGYQAQMGGQIMLPGTPQNQMKGLTLGGSRTGTPSVAPVVSTTTMNPTASVAPAPAQKDPFADLAGLF